jgi:hypothetical protein
LKSFILSHHFWPQKFSSFVPPAAQVSQEIQSTLKSFESCFESLKAARHIEWDHSLGQVEVDLYLKDRTLNVRALPIQVFVISEFTKDKGK